LQGRPRFLDASIFINWLKTDSKRALHDETALISGYTLQKIELGEHPRRLKIALSRLSKSFKYIEFRAMLKVVKHGE